MIIKDFERLAINCSFLGLALYSFGIFTSVSLVGIAPLFLLPLFFIKFQLNKKLWSLNSFRCLLALVVVSIISLLINHQYVPDMFKSLSKIKYFLMPLLLYPALALNCQERPIRLKIIFYSLLIGISLAVFYGLFKWLVWEPHLWDRSPGLTGIMRFGYGAHLIFVLAAACFLFLKKYNRALLSLIIVSFIGFFSSKNRGAILSFVLLMPGLMLLYSRKLFKIGMAGAVVLLSILFIGIFSGLGSQSRIFQSLDSESNMQRIAFYQAAIAAWQEKPLIGHGLKQFSNQVGRIKKERDIAYPNYHSHAHNIFLEFAANLGFIGFMLLVGFLITWWRELGPGLGWIFKPFILAIVICGQVEYLFDANNSFLIFAVYALSQLRQDLLDNLGMASK